MGFFDSLFGGHTENGEKHFQKFLQNMEAGDIASGLNALMTAVSKNHPEAMAYLGKLYFDVEILNKDMNKAFNYSLRAANAGSVMGMYQLGHHYSRGTGTARDDDKALYCWKQAADSGHENAQFMYDFTIYLERERYMLAMDLFVGRNGHEKNVPEAIRIWEKCVNTFNHNTSLYFLGHADIVGAPPYHPQNIQAGVSKFVQAAKLGECEAFMKLMQMYRFGSPYEGIPFEKDENLAGAYAVEIADAIEDDMDEWGQINGTAAWACLYGHGVPVDYRKARMYLKKIQSFHIRGFIKEVDDELTKLGY